jgi:glucose/mannose transport system permease protein
MKRSATEWLARCAVYASLLFFGLIYLIPLWVMLVTSLKSLDEIYAGASLVAWPQVLTFEPWSKSLFEACIGLKCEGITPFYRNTVIIVIPSVVISGLLGALCGYALTQWRFKGSEAIFGLMLFGCFLPYQAILIPLAQALRGMGVTEPLLALIIIHSVYGIPFTTLFFRNYYISFPNDPVKAAMIDGAGFFRIFWRIVLPASLPIITVVVIFQFTEIWNEYLFGVSFASGDDAPITVALANIVNVTTGRKQYNLDMASALLAALPTLIVYMLAGRYFVRGLTAGAVKG